MYIIAIDGPAASGKSTVSKLIASRLGFEYLDTGAMYRAYTLYVIQNNIDPYNEELINEHLKDIKLNFKDKKLYMNDIDVTTDIRLQDVTSLVSVVCAYKKVREFMVDEQRRIAFSSTNGVILDGRDIGTVVFPNADLKIYLIADTHSRAMRRKLDNDKLGINLTLEEIEKDLERRDYIDSHREHSPLTKARDAIELNNSNLTLEETADKIISYVKK